MFIARVDLWSVSSLLESGVVGLEEGLESDAHVLVFVLLAQLVTQLLDAVLFKLSVHLLLHDRGAA